jgi:acetyl esterase
MPLDPAAAAVLELIRKIGRPPLETLTPVEAREVMARSRPVLQPPGDPVAEVEDLDCPGPAGPIRLRRYRGAGTGGAEVLPCLLFMHGGGGVIGDLDSHDQPCRLLANVARCCVIAVDYRLAPEHPYPAAVEDCAAALIWVAGNTEALRVDRDRIAVGGDSAGGNLAAVLALLARDGAAPKIGFQLLLYPSVDLASEQPSFQRFTEGLILTAATVRWFYGHYAPDQARRSGWRASPLRAASHRGVAGAYVMTAGYDPLVDEGIAYARRLEEDGVRVTHIHMADQLHGFLTMGRLIPASDLALRQAALSLAWHWAGG